MENNAAFDMDEQAILSKIVPDLPDVEVSNDLPGEQAAAAAPAAAAPVAETPAGELAAAPAADANASAPAEAPAAPQGDTRGALRASRRSEHRLRGDVDSLRAELTARDQVIEDLKQGKAAPASTSTEFTVDELADIAEAPLYAKIVNKQRELDEKMARLTVATPKAEPEFVAATYDPEIQEVIDNVPDLLAWQYDPAGQEKFQLAVQHDNVLRVTPGWKDKSATERFAEAARLTKASFATTPTPAAQAAQRLDPAAVIAGIQADGPKGISDFRGGGTNAPPTANYAGMSDEQIMASLPTG